MLREFVNPDSSYGDKTHYGEHLRVRKLYGKPFIEELIKKKVEEEHGQLLITSKFYQKIAFSLLIFVTASVESDLQDRIQSSVKKNFNKDVRLIHLNFQPRENYTFWSPKLADVNYQGVV